MMDTEIFLEPVQEERLHIRILRRYQHHISRQEFRQMVLGSVALFCVSLVANFYAIAFATEKASNYVTDIILSNTPVFAVEDLFVYGTFVIIGLSVFIIMYHPKQIPFALNAIALFLLIRSGFTSLTHLAPFPTHAASDFGTTITKAFFGGDRFFSGHTGLPFLGALAFWHNKTLRYFFLATSAYFAVVVLLGHLHYSIDVLSAFFITYSIYHLAQWLFPKTHELFISEDTA